MSEEEVETTDKSDSLQKIEEFTKEGHKLLQDGDLVNSFSAYEKAVELAEQNDEPFTIRACLFNLGACCVANGDASKGLEYLLRATPAQKDGDGSMNYADLHYNMAVAHDILGKPSEARTCYEISLEGYKTNTNLEMQGEVCLKLGGTLTTLNMFDLAANAFEQGKEIFEKLEDERHELLCVSSQATLLAEMRNEVCQDLLKVVIDRVENLNDDLLKAKVCSDVGLVYTSSGHFPNAAAYLNKALSLIQSGDGDQKLQASVCQNLGAIYNQLGSFVKATIYHEKAIELYGLLGMRYAQGHAFSNLGFAFGQLGDLDKSGEYFMHALQAAKDCQDSRGQWQANEGLSAVHFQKKEYGKAVSCLKEALAILTFGGTKDEAIHERVVAKLSDALECQLASKRLTEEVVSVKEHHAPRVSVDGTESQKSGRMRPREKNHKFVARGLDFSGQEEEEEQCDDDDAVSDSTFDSITSYSGSSVGSDNEGADNSASKENVAESNGLTPKKDPLNNTYEIPQDVIRVIHEQEDNGGYLQPVEPPADQIEQPTEQRTEQPSKTKSRSRICVIQ